MLAINKMKQQNLLEGSQQEGWGCQGRVCHKEPTTFDPRIQCPYIGYAGAILLIDEVRAKMVHLERNWLWVLGPGTASSLHGQLWSDNI